MTLVKIDHPRRIDHVIDYFGAPAHPEWRAPRPHGGAAVDPRESRRREAA